MNKYQEALYELSVNAMDNTTEKKFLLKETKFILDSDRIEKRLSQIDLLQELVDKATPMKPTREYRDTLPTEYCGSCGYTLTYGGGVEYCEGCGQHIDWSE